MISIPAHQLNDGTTLPALGLGTWPMGDEEAEGAVSEALKAGYRLVDTATNYRNESGVGRGVARSGVPREEIVLQTKLPGRHHEFEAALASGRESLATLGLDRIDVLLIHWPNPSVGKFVEAWRALADGLPDLAPGRPIGRRREGRRWRRAGQRTLEVTRVVPGQHRSSLLPRRSCARRA